MNPLVKGNRANEKVRAAIDKAGLMYWQIAAQIGIADTTFTKWLRIDLSDEKRELIMDAIKELKK